MDGPLHKVTIDIASFLLDSKRGMQSSPQLQQQAKQQQQQQQHQANRLRCASPGASQVVVSPPVQAPSRSALTLLSLVAADATHAPPQARLVPSKGWLDGSVLLSVPND